MRFTIATVSVLALVVLSGCKVEPDPQAAEQIQTGAAKAWKSTSEAAQNAGESISKSSAQAGQTGRIKVALSTSKDVDTAHLSVETIDKTIYLKGSVPTEEMKRKADAMAKAIADKGYTVQDDLKVDAKKPMKDSRITDDEGP
jgi:hyperosmotically inducible protein